MMEILLGFLLFFLCYRLGFVLLSRLSLSMGQSETMVYATALGLGLLSYSVLLIGLLLGLQPAALWLLVAVLSALFIQDFPPALKLLKNQIIASWNSFSKTDLAIFFFSLTAVSAAALGLLAPETANDSLCYHLHIPKLFLEMGKVDFIPHEFNSLFPFLMEMLYTLALGLGKGLPGGSGGIVLAKFFHFGTGFLAMMAITVFLRRYVSIALAWLGGLLFITTPVVINELATTYVDVGAACFSTMALVAVMTWFQTGKRNWIILSGIFCGLALSVKYLALISVLGIILIITGKSFKKRNPRVLFRNLVYFGAAAFLFSAYWYIRSYEQLGNPVYPYFYSIFKSGDPDVHYDDIGVPRNLLSFLMLPWTMTMHPEKFEGFGVQIGPAYLAFLPACFLVRMKKMKPAIPLLIFAVFYLICWFFLGQSLRFFIPVLPVLAILIAMGFSRLISNEKTPIFLKYAIIFVFFIHAGLAVYHYRGDYRVALGLESRQAYLTRVERTYAVADFVNKNLPGDAKILNCDDARMFYFARSIVRESVYALRSLYFEKAGSAEQVIKDLKEQGFTHVLHVQSPRSTVRDLAPSLRIAYLLLDTEKPLAEFMELIYTKQFTDNQGKEFLYQLYRIRL